MRSALTLLAVVAIAFAPLGCGGDDSSDQPTLTVSAAASLKKAFESYAKDFETAKVRYSFAGSDELAAQIRQGAKPDVFAAANTELPQQLHQAGLVEKPTVFAGNRLVIAVTRGSSTVNSIDDLEREGVDLVVGSPSVPVGSYTRDLLERLGKESAKSILSNVRSSEPDVAGVVGKLTQGAADAGFVYVTDLIGAGGKLRAIELPSSLQPSVEYGVAVVKDSDAADEAKEFVDDLVNGAGRDALRRAGFELPSNGERQLG
jgi:molybdate transport system substrate-binding protein